MNQEEADQDVADEVSEEVDSFLSHCCHHITRTVKKG